MTVGSLDINDCGDNDIQEYFVAKKHTCPFYLALIFRFISIATDKLRQTDVYGNPTFLLSQNNRPLPSLQIGNYSYGYAHSKAFSRILKTWR